MLGHGRGGADDDNAALGNGCGSGDRGQIGQSGVPDKAGQLPITRREKAELMPGSRKARKRESAG